MDLIRRADAADAALVLDTSTRVAAAARSGLIDLRFAPPRFDCRISLLSAFLSALNVIKWFLINTPFEHVYVTGSQPDLLTSSHSRLPGAGRSNHKSTHTRARARVPQTATLHHLPRPSHRHREWSRSSISTPGIIPARRGPLTPLSHPLPSFLSFHTALAQGGGSGSGMTQSKSVAKLRTEVAVTVEEAPPPVRRLPRRSQSQTRDRSTTLNHQSHLVMGMIKGLSHSRRHLALLVSIALQFE